MTKIVVKARYYLPDRDGEQLNKSCKRSYCDLSGSGEDDDESEKKNYLMLGVTT